VTTPVGLVVEGRFTTPVFEYNVYVNRLAILVSGEIGVHEIQIVFDVASWLLEDPAADPHLISETAPGITTFRVLNDPKAALNDAAAFT